MTVINPPLFQPSLRVEQVFDSPILPKGVNLCLPMSADLRAILKDPTYKPAL
jgi:hypothetical protein